MALPPWWLPTTACAPQSRSLAGLLAFLFLAPCTQLAFLAALDLAFLAASLALLRLRRGGSGDAAAPAPEHEALLRKPSPPLRYAVRRAAALGASAVFAAASAVLLALAVALLPDTPWRALECAFLAAHAVAHGAVAWAVAASGRGAGAGAAAAPAVFPVHLRAFWLATALVSALASTSAALRWADDALIFPNDFLAFAGLLVSLPLAYAALTGFTAHGGVVEEGEEERSAGRAEEPVTPYATASFLSRATFSWIYPLISKGHAAGSLTTKDVPAVSPDHRAETSYARFISNWPVQGSRQPVAVALWLSFWPQLVVTAALGLLRLGAMYVGPSLIDHFVEFIRHGGTPWEGLRLVLILLAGKVVQTLASHHYSFQAMQLGMRIRGALQTALYRKSLRLSTGARRAHGTGAIVSYMQMDAGTVSSAMNGLHGLWLMPLQIVVALLLLYSYLGAAVFTTLAVMAAVSAIGAFANKLNLSNHLKFRGVRDSRIKALTEMLNHMRVIKLQAWEDTFAGKVRELRQEELGWLRKMMLFMCANDVVFSSGPLAMTVLVFATYLASGGELDAGKVFTAKAFFGMLQGPMQRFPRTIIVSMQAYVSLGRLNKFLMDAEIESAAVERIESGAAGLDTVAVKVQGGEFAWDGPGEVKGKDVRQGHDAAENGWSGHGVEENGRGDEPEMETTVLKGINMEIRRGELAAVVGTVGSGKSSLLSCIMGEMHKISGKVSQLMSHSEPNCGLDIAFFIHIV
jgi:ATP-binding cassette, subfamily C (CFTR/MRP), member 1